MLSASNASSLLGLLVAAAVLYFARDVLIPLALAILVSFLLAPVVRRLEYWKLGRVPSTLLAVALTTAVIGAVGYVGAREALSLAAKLPEYRENIRAKVRALRANDSGTLGKAAEAIKELEGEAAPSAAQPLAVAETPPSALAAAAEWLGPFVKPVGTALAVFVLTILLLLHRENMRERLIGLIGPRQINITTQALGEASYRVSRYLSTLLLVNASFGIPFGIALYFIGIPSALLWALLGTLLRFIPYVGVWIAVAMPVLLAFGIFDGWTEVTAVLGTFLVLELLLVNAVEPWLYGRSAGISPIAVIAAALFWTWLWGPVGLLLAVPLTVCIAVMGRYIPELGWVNTLLGVEPVLEPEARLYQRLVALDDEEAMALAHEYAREHGVAALYDSVLVPALSLAESDRHAGALEPDRARFVAQTVREIIDEVAESAPQESRCVHVCIVPAHDEADELAGAMLARLLPGAQLLSSKSLAAEVLERVSDGACKLVCICAVPPHAASHAAYRARRMRQRFPELKTVIALLTANGIERAKPRLLAAGASEVFTRLADAEGYARQISV
ncbi:MAG TPA: AI-2E family transporter [Burkholderiales bacterium]|nr:AI-2E family transporter [Burkholderiales bacterium]